MRQVKTTIFLERSSDNLIQKCTIIFMFSVLKFTFALFKLLHVVHIIIGAVFTRAFLNIFLLFVPNVLKKYLNTNTGSTEIVI